MAKKDIGKLLTTGSAKQRLLLIAENTARGIYGLELLLSDSDYNQLRDSFKKPNEIRLWNDFRNYSNAINNGILNLQGVKYEVLMNYSNLRGYILVWNSIEIAEQLVNSILHETKDIKERKRIAEEGAKSISLLFSQTEIDQEGYIDIKIDFEKDTYKDENGKWVGSKGKGLKTKETSLWYVMNNVKQEAINSIIKYLSWERAILDYMENKGFNVKTYKDKIEGFTREIYSPIIGWGKYSGELNGGFGLSHPRIEEIIKMYSICPNIQEIKVDEDQCTFFRTQILGDEE